MIQTIGRFLLSKLLQPVLVFLLKCWNFVEERPILKAVLITALVIGMFKLLANSCHQNNVLKRENAGLHHRADSLEAETKSREQREIDAYKLGDSLTKYHDLKQQNEYANDTTLIYSKPLTDLYEDTDSLLRAADEKRNARKPK